MARPACVLLAVAGSFGKDSALMEPRKNADEVFLEPRKKY